MNAQNLQSSVQFSGQPELFVQDGNHQIHGHGDPDLLSDRVGARPQVVLEAVQVECRDMEPELLKQRFGDRLSFQGAVSVQQVLPRLSADEVRAEVRRMKEILGAGGGYICAPSHAIQAGTPPENVIAVVEEALQIPLAEIARRAHEST